MRKGRRIRVVFFYMEFFLGFGLICKSREGRSFWLIIINIILAMIIIFLGREREQNYLLKRGLKQIHAENAKKTFDFGKTGLRFGELLG